MKKKSLIITGAIVGLVVLGLIGYPVYAQKTCAEQAKRHNNFTRNGEVYLSIDKGANAYPVTIKLSEFNSLCMQDRFGL